MRMFFLLLGRALGLFNGILTSLIVGNIGGFVLGVHNTGLRILMTLPLAYLAYDGTMRAVKRFLPE